MEKNQKNMSEQVLTKQKKNAKEDALLVYLGQRGLLDVYRQSKGMTEEEVFARAIWIKKQDKKYKLAIQVQIGLLEAEEKATKKRVDDISYAVMLARK